MANMANSKYHTMAKEIIGEEGPRDDIKGARMAGSETGEDMARLDRAMQATNGDLFNMPAAQMGQALGWTNMPPEDMQFLDGATPAIRQEYVNYLVNSDGLGNLQTFITSGVGNAPLSGDNSTLNSGDNSLNSGD